MENKSEVLKFYECNNYKILRVADVFIVVRLYFKFKSAPATCPAFAVRTRAAVLHIMLILNLSKNDSFDNSKTVLHVWISIKIIVIIDDILGERSTTS